MNKFPHILLLSCFLISMIAGTPIFLTTLLLIIIAGLTFRNNNRPPQGHKSLLGNFYENERQLSSILDAVQLGTWHLDLDTGKVRFDDRARNHAGCTEDTGTLAEIIASIPPGERHRVRQDIKQRREIDGAVGLHAITFRIVDDNGSIRRILATPLHTFGPQGRIFRHRYLFGTSKDLGQEQTLKKRTHTICAEHAQIPALCRIGSWCFSITNKQLDWSETTHQIFDTSPDGFTPSIDGLYDYIHPQDTERVSAAWQATIANGKVFDVQYRIMVNGKTKWIHQQAEVERDVRGRPAIVYGIVKDITMQKQTIDELEQSQARLRALTDHQERVLEKERTRVAREIHDELGQSLTALKMELHWLKIHLRPEQTPLMEKTDEMARKIDETVAAVRRISHELRPAILDTLGLAAAIESLVADFRRSMGIRCNTVVPLHPIDLCPSHSSSLFRMAQELMTNIARHAQASRVNVTLKEKGEYLELEVSDNGRGIRKKRKNANSLGLIGIHERAEQLGGEVKITTLPEISGTRVTVTIPRQTAAKGDTNEACYR